MTTGTSERRRGGRARFRIAEPATTLTDYALALFTAALAALLLRRGWSLPHPGVLLWGVGFVATAAAALLGGTVHGFGPRMGARARRGLWRLTLAATGVTGFCLLAGAALAAAPWLRTALLAFAALKLGLYLCWIVARDDFRYAVYHSGVSLLLVLALAGYALLARGETGAGWIVAGILLSLGAALVQRRGWCVHRHLNHNDLFHLIQMGAAYLLYRGGLLL